MLARLYSVLSVALLLQVLCYGAAEAKMISKADMRVKQAAAMERFNLQTSSRASGTGVKNITFSNPRASGISVLAQRHSTYRLTHSVEFYVDGATIPEVDFDVGPSWAGLLPISGNANETRKVCSNFHLLRRNAQMSLVCSFSSGFSHQVLRVVLMISSFGT